MEIPAAIAEHVPALLEFSRQYFISHFESIPGEFVWSQGTKALVRTLFPKLADADPKELRARIERLEAGANGMAAELIFLKSEQPNRDIDSELNEPAAQNFVVDAIAAMMESPSEAKRDVLGRFIAKRLYENTETEQELTLRQAESLVERMNSRHLNALATLYLVHSTPFPPHANTEQIHAWMDSRLLPIVERVANVDPSRNELDYLASLGAVHYDASDTRVSTVATEHASAIEQKLHSLTGDIVSFGSARHVGNFYWWSKQLYEGQSPKKGVRRISLAPYTLTSPGAEIAWTVLERCGVRTAGFYDVETTSE